MRVQTNLVEFYPNDINGPPLLARHLLYGGHDVPVNAMDIGIKDAMMIRQKYVGDGAIAKALTDKALPDAPVAASLKRQDADHPSAQALPPRRRVASLRIRGN